MTGEDFLQTETAWFMLSGVKKLGAVRLNGLLKYYGDVIDIVNADTGELREIEWMDDDIVDEFDRVRRTDYVAQYHRFREQGIDFYSREHEEFPKRLLSIPDVPAGLFVRGKLPGSERKAIAIIGSRTCSNYGSRMSAYFAGELAALGADVISGMALGIDGEAHRAALKAGGETYAVLGCGVDICYPKSNWDLYDRIPEHGGVISEFYPGTAPTAMNFPIRNRIISGLSNAVIAVEARNKSGTLITVDQALEQGREVYAVPGRLTDKLSDGCNNLLRFGARPALTPVELLEEVNGIPEPEPVYEQRKVMKSRKSSGYCVEQMCFTENLATEQRLGSEEAVSIYLALDVVPLPIEEVALRTGIPISRLIRVLGTLELDGFVRKVGFGSYVRELIT